jgi:Sulfotransferase domain
MGLFEKQRGAAREAPSLVGLPFNSGALSDTMLGSPQETVRLPSFIIAGPPRTGTSWLHKVLSQHTSLPNPTKETRFFDTHFHRGLKWYGAHFAASRRDRPVGEVGPTYFASPQACERIAATIPKAKLIFVFRNPVQRVVSLYRIKRAYGMLPWSFQDALDRDPELMESGMYAQHLDRWQRSFPSDQLLCTVYDDLRSDPQSFLDMLCEFIGIPRITLSAVQLGNVHSSERMTEPRSYITTRSATAVADWLKARGLDHVVAAVTNSSLMKLFVGGGEPFPEVSEEVVHELYRRFHPEVERLEEMLRRDLSAWKAAGGQHPNMKIGAAVKSFP